MASAGSEVCSHASTRVRSNKRRHHSLDSIQTTVMIMDHLAPPRSLSRIPKTIVDWDEALVRHQQRRQQESQREQEEDLRKQQEKQEKQQKQQEQKEEEQKEKELKEEKKKQKQPKNEQEEQPQSSSSRRDESQWKLIAYVPIGGNDGDKVQAEEKESEENNEESEEDRVMSSVDSFKSSLIGDRIIQSEEQIDDQSTDFGFVSSESASSAGVDQMLGTIPQLKGGFSMNANLEEPRSPEDQRKQEQAIIDSIIANANNDGAEGLLESGSSGLFSSLQNETEEIGEDDVEEEERNQTPSPRNSQSEETRQDEFQSSERGREEDAAEREEDHREDVDIILVQSDHDSGASSTGSKGRFDRYQTNSTEWVLKSLITTEDSAENDENESEDEDAIEIFIVRSDIDFGVDNVQIDEADEKKDLAIEAITLITAPTSSSEGASKGENRYMPVWVQHGRSTKETGRISSNISSSFSLDTVGIPMESIEVVRRTPLPRNMEPSNNTTEQEEELQNQENNADEDDDDVGLNPPERGSGSTSSITPTYSMDSSVGDASSHGPLFTTRVVPMDGVPYVPGCYAAAAPMMFEDLKWMRILRRLMPEAHALAVVVMRENEKEVGSKKTKAIIRWAENNPIVAAFGVLHKDYASKIPRLADFVDILNWNNRGTQSLSKPRFRRSSVHRDEMETGSCDDRVKRSPNRSKRRHHQSPPKKNHKSQHQIAVRKKRVPALEWDVFLDQAIVARVDKAVKMTKHIHDEDSDSFSELDESVGQLIARMALAHNSSSSFCSTDFSSHAFGLFRQSNSLVTFGKEAVQHELESLAPSIISMARQKIASPEDESSSVFSSRRETKGIFVDRWLKLFARALALGSMTTMTTMTPTSSNASSAGRWDELWSDDDGSGVRVDEMLTATTKPGCGLFLCLGNKKDNDKMAVGEPLPLTTSMVEKTKKSITNCVKSIEGTLGEPLRVVLHPRSTNVPSHVWACLVDGLQSLGVIVEAMASFCPPEELRTMGCAAVTASTVTAPMKLFHLFHSAGEFQQACHSDMIRMGDTVFLDATTLLRQPQQQVQHTITKDVSSVMTCAESEAAVCQDGIPRQLTMVDVDVSFQSYAYPRRHVHNTLDEDDPNWCEATIEDYKKKYKLKIGCFVQDYAISPRILEPLTRFINRHSSIYNLGLAWGGVNGRAPRVDKSEAVSCIQPRGRKWNASAKPTKRRYDLSFMEDPGPMSCNFLDDTVLTSSWGYSAGGSLTGRTSSSSSLRSNTTDSQGVSRSFTSGRTSPLVIAAPPPPTQIYHQVSSDSSGDVDFKTSLLGQK